MAQTEFGVNHPLAVKVWSKKLLHEAIAATYVGKFIGTSKDSLLYRKDELTKSAGDQITYGLRMKLRGDGVQGDGTQEGNEEALTTYSDAILINQLRHATRSKGKMSEQRVPFDVRQEGMDGLRDWWSERMDVAFANHLAGYTVASDTRYTGNNAVIAASANNIMRPTGLTDDASLSTTDTFNLAKVDAAVTRAKTMDDVSSNAQSIIRPLKIDGNDKYVMFLHPYQVRDMRTNTSTGQWLDITKAVYQGSKKSNPIYDGSLGEYNNVVFHEWNRIPQAVANAGTAVANTRRAVLCGAQAACIAFGSENGVDKMTWVEELFDYQNQLGIAAGSIFGIKKSVFNSADFGTIVVPTYAAAS